MVKKKDSSARHLQFFQMIVVFFVALFALYLANTATNVTGAVTADDVFTEDLISEYKETYNEKASGLPDIVFTFFGEEVVNIYISDLDYHLYAVLEDGALIELEPGTQESPTIEVETTYDTIVALQYGELTLANAIDNGLVTFSSDSFVKKAELSVVLYSVDVYDIFS